MSNHEVTLPLGDQGRERRFLLTKDSSNRFFIPPTVAGSVLEQACSSAWGFSHSLDISHVLWEGEIQNSVTAQIYHKMFSVNSRNQVCLSLVLS